MILLNSASHTALLYPSGMVVVNRFHSLYLCNPLSPKSGKCFISPYHNTAQSNVKVNCEKKGNDLQVTKILIV